MKSSDVVEVEELLDQESTDHAINTGSSASGTCFSVCSSVEKHILMIVQIHSSLRLPIRLKSCYAVLV